MISDHRQLAELIDEFFLILKHDLGCVKFVLNFFNLFKQTDLLCYLKRSCSIWATSWFVASSFCGLRLFCDVVLSFGFFSSRRILSLLANPANIARAGSSLSLEGSSVRRPLFPRQ